MTPGDPEMLRHLFFLPQLVASVHLIATPASVENFGSVKITWPNTITPVEGDYITYSCGPTKNISDEIFRCNINATENKRGGGYTGHPPQYNNNQCIFFSLVNLRCDYIFSYVRNNVTVLADVIVPISNSHHNSPTQGHISFGNLPTEMFVSWVSGSQRTSGVQYGTETHKYTHFRETYELATTYHAEEVCNYPANTTSQSYWRFPGYFHHVLLEELVPHTRYYYRYGNDVDGWSDERSFLSRADSTVDEVKFLGYGDQDWDEPGSVQTAALALRDIVSHGFDDFVLHFGDLSYGEGDVSDWDHWATQVEPVASRSAYMVSYGNHEYNYIHGKWKDQTLLPMRTPKNTNRAKALLLHNKDQNRDGDTTYDFSNKQQNDDSGSFSPPGGNYGSDSKGECGIAMVHRFRSPSNGRRNNQGSLAWYSFDSGPIHVIQMSSEHDWLIGSEQYTWLNNDLKQASLNRKNVPWILVTAHRMMYSSQLCEDGDNRTSVIFRRNIEPLLLKYNVNVVMVGHQHSFERTCPLLNGTCVNKNNTDQHGIVHITAGTAGAGVEKCGFDLNVKYSLVRSDQWGYLRGHVTKKNFTIQFVSDALGTVWDEIVLSK